MSTDTSNQESHKPDSFKPELNEEREADLYEQLMSEPDLPDPPRPINWNLLRAHEAEEEWLALNQWVNWLRYTYGLPVAVVPPFWHRHPELLWELSALHLHWLSSYDPEQTATGPLAWHKEFASARIRLRDWVAICGTRNDSDRPTRQAAWPGEPPQKFIEDEVILNRDQDFLDFVAADAAERMQIEDEAMATLFGNESEE